MIAGVAGFLHDRQVFILTVSTLLLLAILFFLAFPGFLSMIQLIKFGVKNAFFKIMVPSFIVGLLAAAIGYGLLELRELLAKRAGNR